MSVSLKYFTNKEILGFKKMVNKLKMNSQPRIDDIFFTYPSTKDEMKLYYKNCNTIIDFRQYGDHQDLGIMINNLYTSMYHTNNVIELTQLTDDAINEVRILLRQNMFEDFHSLKQDIDIEEIRSIFAQGYIYKYGAYLKHPNKQKELICYAQSFVVNVNIRNRDYKMYILENLCVHKNYRCMGVAKSIRTFIKSHMSTINVFICMYYSNTVIQNPVASVTYYMYPLSTDNMFELGYYKKDTLQNIRNVYNIDKLLAIYYTEVMNEKNVDIGYDIYNKSINKYLIKYNFTLEQFKHKYCTNWDISVNSDYLALIIENVDIVIGKCVWGNNSDILGYKILFYTANKNTPFRIYSTIIRHLYNTETFDYVLFPDNYQNDGILEDLALIPFNIEHLNFENFDTLDIDPKLVGLLV